MGLLLTPDHPLCAVPGLWHATAPRCGAVVLFRLGFELLRAARGLRLVLSASHRFELRLDGRVLSRGPARAAAQRWGVRRVALPPMAAGRHVLAVVVAHDGDAAGESQDGPEGFFACVGLGTAAELIAPGRWQAWHDRACTPCHEDGWDGLRVHTAVGAGERFDAALHPWGWDRPGSGVGDDWPAALALRPLLDVWGNLALGCQPAPEMIPTMAERPCPMRLVAVEGVAEEAAHAWAAGRAALPLAPGARLRLVLDRGAVGVHWPCVRWDGAGGSELRLIWCEAPRDAQGRLGPRDRVQGQHLFGQRDVLHCDDGRDRSWTPRWLRSGRYLAIDIAVGERPGRLHPVALADTGFPFRTRLRLRADPAWARLLAISDRTLRACAHELIWDCPHYEQCQFPGDGRVQAMAHYLLYGDDRLARKAVRDFADAQRPDGLLPCRAPLRHPQRIDTFTLQWALMLDELLRWRGAVPELPGIMPAARAGVAAFLARRRGDGLPDGALVAPFIDWSPGFACGNAPQDADGGSAIVALLLAQACDALARLEDALGWRELAPRWRREGAALRRAVRATCLHGGWLHDTPTRRSRSVHAQVEAVHAGLLRGAAGARALARACASEDVIQPGTRYYRWHLGRAWLVLGRPDRALTLVDGWLAQARDIPGLTTWPESDANPRSDCHGWGAYPILAAAGILLGVRPLADGCAALAIDPWLGGRNSIAGRLHIPQGEVRVEAVRIAPGRIEVAWSAPVPVRIAGRPVARRGRMRLAERRFPE